MAEQKAKKVKAVPVEQEAPKPVEQKVEEKQPEQQRPFRAPRLSELA
jgi:hypothetical protein